MLTALILVALGADPATKPPHTVIHFRSEASQSAPTEQPVVSPIPATLRPLPPTGMALEVGVRTARRLVGEDLSLSQSRIEKYALSQKFLALAGRIEGDPLARWGAYHESLRLAVEAASPVGMFAAIDQAGRHFEIDVPQRKMAALRDCLNPAQDPRRCAPIPSLLPIANAALLAATDAEKQNDVETALALMEIARTAALQGEHQPALETAVKRRNALRKSIAGRVTPPAK